MQPPEKPPAYSEPVASPTQPGVTPDVHHALDALANIVIQRLDARQQASIEQQRQALSDELLVASRDYMKWGREAVAEQTAMISEIRDLIHTTANAAKSTDRLTLVVTIMTVFNVVLVAVDVAVHIVKP